MGGMPTSSWACPRRPRFAPHAHEDVGMPPTGILVANSWKAVDYGSFNGIAAKATRPSFDVTMAEARRHIPALARLPRSPRFPAESGPMIKISLVVGLASVLAVAAV